MPSIHDLVTAQVVFHAATARCKSKLHHWGAIWSTPVRSDVVFATQVFCVSCCLHDRGFGTAQTFPETLLLH